MMSMLSYSQVIQVERVDFDADFELCDPNSRADQQPLSVDKINSPFLAIERLEIRAAR